MYLIQKYKVWQRNLILKMNDSNNILNTSLILFSLLQRDIKVFIDYVLKIISLRWSILVNFEFSGLILVTLAQFSYMRFFFFLLGYLKFLVYTDRPKTLAPKQYLSCYRQQIHQYAESHRKSTQCINQNGGRLNNMIFKT